MPTGKASESTAGRRELLRSGHALPPTKPGGRPGFPVGDAKHWDKAFEAVGRSGGGARREALRKLLIKTAPEFGKSGRIKGSWLDTSGGSKNMSMVDRQLLVDLAGSMSMCPQCGYHADSAEFAVSGGSAGTTSPSQPEELRTAANAGLQSAAGFNAGQIGLSNVIGLAGGRTRQAVASPDDILVTRGENGRAVIRHRRGGDKIGEVYRTESGQWTSSVEGGAQLSPHSHQRGALNELVGTHNRSAGTAYHRPSEPRQPLATAPAQTPLMQRFGVPAVTVLATPSNGAGDGPRTTDSDGPAGLSPKGVTIYKKLVKKMPAARALAFARRAQNMGGSGD
jgi:hypothetical protein